MRNLLRFCFCLLAVSGMISAANAGESPSPVADFVDRAVEKIVLKTAEAGAEQKFGGGKIVLQNYIEKRKKSTAALKLQGDMDRVLGISGFDSDGEQVRGGESSSSSDGKIAWIKTSFNGPLERIEMLVGKASE